MRLFFPTRRLPTAYCLLPTRLPTAHCLLPTRLASAKVELSKRFTRQGIDSFLRRELRSVSGRVLDLGAGLQPFAELLPPRTVALDHRSRPGLHLVADAHRLPFKDETFDAVVCTEVFEHLIDPPTAAREIIRVLKPGGRLALTTRFCFPLHERPADFWRFTPYTLARLFAPLEPVVLPQHSAYRTLLVLLVRLVMEPTPLNRLIAPPVLALCGLLWGLEPVANRILPSDSISSGYLVSGQKPTS